MSPVQFYCVFCGNALQASSDLPSDFMKCPCCSRDVPVPRPASGSRNFTNYPSVLPPGVLDILVKFKCTACSSVLYADARYEGREVVCSGCGIQTGIPRWSQTPNWPRFSEVGEIDRMRARKSQVRTEAPRLSLEEIDYLRGTESRKPEAAA